MSDLELRVERYDDPAATELIAQVQQEYVVRYGGPDSAPVDPDEFAAPRGFFLVGYLDGEPVAMGGVRLIGPGLGEVKRMYVAPAVRGRGLSREVLAALEDRAREMGVQRLLLETGLMQPEAMRLYETSGYERVTDFGHYQGHPNARAYGKDL